MAVTAEESGLLGSEFYAENPLVPLEKTAAVFNVDALYPIGRAKDVEVIGFGASELEELLAKAASSQGRTLTPDRKPEAGYFYRSDHFNFAKAGVPALYIKSGAVLRDERQAAGVAWQEKYVAERYHKPDDEYRRQLECRRLDRGPAPAVRSRRAGGEQRDLAGLERGQRVPRGARQERGRTRSQKKDKD